MTRKRKSSDEGKEVDIQSEIQELCKTKGGKELIDYFLRQRDEMQFDFKEFMALKESVERSAAAEKGSSTTQPKKQEKKHS